MWRMRYYMKKDPGEKKAENYATDLGSAQGAARAVENLLLNPRVGRLDIVAEGHVPDEEPVNSVPLQWVCEKRPGRTDLWVGLVGGKRVAFVFDHPHDGPGAQYSLALGDLGPMNVTVRNIESGKRAAQRALTRVARSLIA